MVVDVFRLTGEGSSEDGGDARHVMVVDVFRLTGEGGSEAEGTVTGGVGDDGVGVEGSAYVLEEEDKVGLVGGGTREFPVDIDPVEVVLSDQPHALLREVPPRGRARGQ